MQEREKSGINVGRKLKSTKGKEEGKDERLNGPENGYFEVLFLKYLVAISRAPHRKVVEAILIFKLLFTSSNNRTCTFSQPSISYQHQSKFTVCNA